MKILYLNGDAGTCGVITPGSGAGEWCHRPSWAPSVDAHGYLAKHCRHADALDAEFVHLGSVCRVGLSFRRVRKRLQGDGEACDDGNQSEGDGCTASCTLEPGWRWGDDRAVPICGDKLIVGAEKCDDGNSVGGDGCSADCQVEKGWSCSRTLCRTRCGDGITAGSEVCDGPYCSQGRNTVLGRCGDGVVLAGVEDCDSVRGCTDECKASFGFTCVFGMNSCTASGLPPELKIGQLNADQAVPVGDCDDGQR